jgi:hypothetical protein
MIMPRSVAQPGVKIKGDELLFFSFIFARQAFAIDHHRRLFGFSWSNSDGLSACAASAGLDAQMRNIREKGRNRDRDELKQMAKLFTRRRIANKRGQRFVVQAALAN